MQCAQSMSDTSAVCPVIVTVGVDVFFGEEKERREVSGKQRHTEPERSRGGAPANPISGLRGCEWTRRAKN